MTTLQQIDAHAVLNPDVDDILLHVRGLVLVRDLLIERGATCAEIAAHTDEIERRRQDLADLIGACN